MHRTKVKVAEDALDANDDDRARQPRRLRPRRGRRRQPDERARRRQDDAAGAGARRLDETSGRGARGRRPGLARRRPPRRRFTSPSSSSTPTTASAASATSTPTWCARRSPTSTLAEHRPAGDRERRQPGLPGGVPGRRGRPGDGLLGHRGRGQAAQVPAHVPRLRAGRGQQDRPARAPRLRPRAAPREHRTVQPRRSGDAGQRPDRRGRGRLPRMAGGGPAARRGGRAERDPAPATATPSASTSCSRSGSPGEPGVLRARRPSRSRAAAIAMAERFARGGRLVAFGATPAARSDARHVAVEFVHPVIVGKRALPAIGLAAEGGPLGDAGRAGCRAGRHRDRLRARRSPGSRRPRARSRWRGERGCLTIAFAPVRRRVGVRRPTPTTRSSARSWSRRSTTCSGSWSTSSSTTAGCSRGARRGQSTTPARRASSTRSSPRRETDLEPSSTTSALGRCSRRRRSASFASQTLADNRDGADGGRRRAARAASKRAGKLLAFGNGGSATDAMDVVADFRDRRRTGRGRRGARST